MSLSLFFNTHRLAVRPAAMCLFIAALLSGCASQSAKSPQSADVAFSELKRARYGHASVSDGQYVYLIGGANAEGVMSSIEIFDPSNGKTTLLTDKIIGRRYLAAAWDGKESIYIFGGMSKTGRRLVPEATVEVFNTRTQEVTTTTEMPEPRRFNSAVRLGSKIYLVGGSVFRPKPQGRGHYMRATGLVSVFDVNTQSWSRVANLPSSKDTRAFVYDGQVCVVGGYNGRTSLAALECYSPESDQWRTLTSVPAPVSAHSPIAYKNKLYLFGDYQQMDQVLVYDFVSANWRVADTGYRPSRHTAAARIGDRVYVSGGNTGGSGPFHNHMQIVTLPF